MLSPPVLSPTRVYRTDCSASCRRQLEAYSAACFMSSNSCLQSVFFFCIIVVLAVVSGSAISLQLKEFTKISLQCTAGSWLCCTQHIAIYTHTYVLNVCHYVCAWALVSNGGNNYRYFRQPLSFAILKRLPSASSPHSLGIDCHVFIATNLLCMVLGAHAFAALAMPFLTFSFCLIICNLFV